ncbi:MAG: hypothetical protein AAFV62_08260 [Pseudomonadota bacterium]
MVERAMGEPKGNKLTETGIGEPHQVADQGPAATKVELKLAHSEPAPAEERSETSANLEEVGLVLAKNKQFREAADYLKSAYQQTGLSLDGLSYLVRSCYQLRDANEATVYVKALLERDPEHLDGLKFAARISNLRKDWAVARSYWERLRALRPRDPEPVRQMMRSSERLHDWATATELAEDLRTLDPKNPDIERCACKCAIEMREASMAEAKAPLVAEGDPETALKLADLAIKRGLYAVAGRIIVATREAVSREGGRLSRDIDVRSREWAEEWVGGAMRAEMENDIPTSTELYRAARMVDTTFEPAVRGLDRLRRPAVEGMKQAYRDQDYGVAVTRAREAMLIDPDYPDSYLIAGRSMVAMDDPTAAFEFLSRGIEVAPNDPWMHLNYGRVAERSCEFASAHRSYARVLELPRRSGSGTKHIDEAKRKMAQLERAAIRETKRLYKEELYDEARELMIFLREIDADPTLVDPLFASLTRKIEKQVREYYHVKHEHTLAEAEKLLELDPDNAYGRKVAGRMLVADKEYVDACPHWEKLAILQGDVIEPWLQIARCCSKMGEPDKALEAAYKVLEIEPGHVEALKITARVGI